MESVTEWPYDKVLQLIVMFQQRPMLWDTQCDAYKDRQKRHEVTLELATHFNVEKDEIERKLKNLQSHFYREVKKEKSKSSVGNGTIGVYRSKWFAYQAMKFLEEKSKPRRTHIQVGNKTLATRQKPTASRVSIAKHCSDKSRFKKLEHEVRNSSLREVSTIKNENTASTVNDFLYIDANQQNNLDNSQMDYWEEKSISSQDPIEFAMQTNEAQQQQSQHIRNFEDNRPNEKELSTPCKQDVKTLRSKDTIAPAIDFLLTELKAHGSNDPELIFYRSLIPDIMKLSDKKRRQFKEVVLCTLNKLLDEDENACPMKI
ncbi:PREDICTED: uncharacterized protein LOC105457743 [Wasmannia auropunctata]|uniref:uncharacterized protein LOC105457743 n=1 Tax=Wasmannia auropunctata TaxID=64793 RepID=UPI0005EEA200|nr:PREDICTED: uncharacterized protein LOC105457743 [Wasmannia auropunctata]